MSTTASPTLSFRTMHARKRAATHNNCNRSMDMITEKPHVTLENSFEKTLSDALSPQLRPRSGAILKLGGSPDRMRPVPVSSLPTSMTNIRPASAMNSRVRTRQKRPTKVENREPEMKKEKSMTLEEYRDPKHMKSFLATKFQQFKDLQTKEKEKDGIDFSLVSAVPSRPGTPRRKSSSPERSQKKLRKATGSIFAKLEKNLFFTRVLSNYVDEDKASLSFVEKVNQVDRDGKEDRFKWMMKREKKNNNYINLWLTRTNQITNEITQYISKPDDSKDLIETCQEKVDSQVKRIRVKNTKMDQGFDRSDDRVDPADKEEVLKKAKAWNPALYNAFKGHSVKRKNDSDNKSKDRQGFYNYLLLKEKKTVNQIVLNASCSKPRETFSRSGGRSVFNVSSG